MTRSNEFDFLSDLYKDALGSRPGVGYMAHFDSMTHAEQLIEVGALERMVDASIDQDRCDEAISKINFEILVEKTMGHGAGDRQTALRWIIEGLDSAPQDAGYMCYCFGLGSSEAAQFAFYDFGGAWHAKNMPGHLM